jgi:osmoprotectant transport system permease protein
MDILVATIRYAMTHQADVAGKTLTHLGLSGVALLAAVLIGVPLGVLISRYGAAARLAINAAGILRVIPSIAILFLLLPSQGIGFRPAAIALAVLAIPPILINTDAGMRSVDRAAIEAGRGMGMSYWQILRKVQFPLAMPVVVAGLRTATLEVIASAALAALIGGGGLGDFIATGLALSRNDILLVGAILVALLALTAEVVLSALQRRLTRRRA